MKVAAKVLKNIEDIAFCNLTEKDVVRHPLVQKIIKAYERYDTEQEKKRKNDRDSDRERAREDGNKRRNG